MISMQDLLDDTEIQKLVQTRQFATGKDLYNIPIKTRLWRCVAYMSRPTNVVNMGVFTHKKISRKLCDTPLRLMYFRLKILDKPRLYSTEQHYVDDMQNWPSKAVFTSYERAQAYLTRAQVVYEKSDLWKQYGTEFYRN